jgi:hypothetical protein
MNPLYTNCTHHMKCIAIDTALASALTIVLRGAVRYHLFCFAARSARTLSVSVLFHMPYIDIALDAKLTTLMCDAIVFIHCRCWMTCM